MIVFIIVQFVAVLLPGYVLLRLANLRTDNCAKNLFFSYGIGYAHAIFLYSLLALFNMQVYSKPVTAVLVFIYFFLLLWEIKKQKKFNFDISDFKFSLPVILIIFCIFSFTLLLENHFVGARSELKIDQDLMYWFRNSVAATRKFPLEDLSIAGANFYYHYFSSFYNAFMHFLTGAELFDICFTYSVFTNTLLLFGSMFVFSDYFLKNKTLKYLCIFIILFCSGFEYYTVCFYSHKLYIHSFGALEGIALSLFFFSVFLSFYESDIFSISKLLLSLLLFYSAVGTKAPVACVIMVPAGGACITLLFCKKTFFKGALCGLFLLSVFFFVYMLFIRGISHPAYSGGETNSLKFSFTDSLKRSYSGVLFEFLFQKTNSFPMSYFVAFLVYIVAFNPLLFATLIFSFVDLKENPLTKRQLILFSGIIVGFLLNIFFSHIGSSQMYFSLLVVPLSAVLSFERISISKRTFKNKKIGILFFPLFLIGIGNFFFSMYKDGSDGIIHYVKATFMNKTMEKNAKTVSKKEIEGLRWIRDNTDENSIIVTNKILAETGSGRSFVTSCFAQRPVFLEGDDYGAVPAYISKTKRKELVRKFFAGDANALDILKKECVGYAVIFKAFLYNPDVLTFGKIEYENEEIAVLSLL